MPKRKSSLAPAILAMFLVPVAIPVLFAMLATPWSEGARAQDQSVGIKRAELPPTRPAPMQSGAYPRKSVVNRRSEKLNESDRNGQPQRPSSKVAVQGESRPQHSPAPSLRPRTSGAIANAQPPQKIPQVQQASRATIPQPTAPTQSDFVDTEQRSQEVSRKFDADIAQNRHSIKRPLPVRQPTVEVEDEVDELHADHSASTKSETSESEAPFDPLDLPPKLATTELIRERTAKERDTEPLDEMIPEPLEELAQDDESAHNEPVQGVTNAYFEEPLIEEPLIEEEMPSAPVRQRMLAEDFTDGESDEDNFRADAAAQNNAPQSIVSPVNGAHETTAPPSILPLPTQSPAQPKWYTDLRAINSIDLREAVQLPPVAAGDNSTNIFQPQNQANTFLSQRKAVNFSSDYWTPWKADRDSYPFCHYPLYFEDPNLERCGRGWSCFTTFVSLGRFYSNIPFIPYRVTAEPHLCRVRSLPDCPACHKFGYDAYLPPWSWKAAAVQTGAYFGAIYIVP